MLRMFARLSILVALLASVGCGLKHQTTPLNPSPHPLRSKPTSEVHVFTSGRPATPYHEVMLLQAEEESIYANSDESEVLQELRKRAGVIGCDAIIVLSATNNLGSGGNAGSRFSRTLRGLRVTCAVYDDAAFATKTATAGSGTKIASE